MTQAEFAEYVQKTQRNIDACERNLSKPLSNADKNYIAQYVAQVMRETKERRTASARPNAPYAQP